ncbi:acetate kinase [Ephemerocybe angulata]|uniref:Probable acetate kinase n=1 Tax=Ephemerocybe angulata TaxID=980116 RepID=A0A8H6I1W1_9AGAR|nr:acetate kinase [Tulosesus angulatus]
MSPPSGNLILALNSGSSSLKITLYSRRSPSPNSPNDAPAVDLVLSASISDISAPPAKFKLKGTAAAKSGSSEGSSVSKEESVDSIRDHASAFDYFLRCLEEEASIKQEDIQYICHRVVHGGNFAKPVVITKESYEDIEHLTDLAPLHNGAALSVIQVCIDKLPHAKSIAYFDTTFHRPMPVHIASVALDQEIAKKKGLKKYGFHGLSYGFILRSVAKFLNKPTEQLNLIVLHLGSGASACAIKAGQSLDTSMGLTPVSGLPGATRSGAIDPSLIFHYTNRAGKITHKPSAAVPVDVTVAEDILNRHAGWKVLTGTTDFGLIAERAELEDEDEGVAERNVYRLAFELFVDRILNYVGAYYLKLDGQVDALVFAGGIGEKSVPLREAIARKVRCLGFEVLDEKNNADVGESKGTVVSISVPDTEKSGPGAGGRNKQILVCHTDEQFEMANDCALDRSRW